MTVPPISERTEFSSDRLSSRGYDFSSVSTRSTLRARSNDALGDRTDGSPADIYHTNQSPLERDNNLQSSDGTPHNDNNKGLNLLLTDDGPDSLPHDQPIDQEHDQSTPWLPLTLRSIFICMLSLLALGLCLTTVLLLWRSETNYGLGSDYGSSAVFFGWSFSPTLIAVIYIQLTSMLFNNVKRTAPFARLARPDGAVASSSLLQAPGAWWNALYDGFSKKKNGSYRRSWTLICASLVNILGFLAISPLSAALLTSQDMAVPRQEHFLHLSPRLNTSLPLDADRTTHFRTIGHFLQDVSTSPWITDNYTMLPFWPADWQSAPLGSLQSSISQVWRVETTMFRSDFSCTEMTLESMFKGNRTIAMNGSDDSIIWSSPNGCRYELEAQKGWFTAGGSSWSNTSTFAYSPLPLTNLDSYQFYHVNNTAQCKGLEILIMSESWDLQEPKMSTHLCKTAYYMANITASVDLSNAEPDISFDESEYSRKRVPVPDTVLNTTQLQELSLDPNWAGYMLSLIWKKSASMGGPSVMLGGIYGFNITAMVNDPAIVRQASRIKQRFLGEVLQSSLSHQGSSHEASIKGLVTTIEKRVVVLKGPAIALGALFFLSSCLLIVLWRSSRLQNRPLNLKNDPTTTAGITSLITQDTKTKLVFGNLSQVSAKEMWKLLNNKHYYTDSHTLFEMNRNGSESGGTSAEERQKSDSAQVMTWNSGVLRLTALTILIMILVSVVVGILVLYHFAESSQLYQKAFVYQTNISVFSKEIPAVAPFSMIPTLVAVGIGLWWGAIDDNFRRLQPYLAMSKGRPTFSQGICLSYQSSYMMWAASKAAKNRHWLLFLVTLGTTLSPIFTTTMSALFQREPGNISQPITLDRGLEIRQIPFLFETKQPTINHQPYSYAARIIGDLYSNLSAHWMYTATNQLTLNGSEPAWSKNGWSFVPLDLSSIDSIESLPTIGENTDLDSPSHDSPTNISFTTPAVRGRIECSFNEGYHNLSSWLTRWDPSPNYTMIPEDVEGFELGAKYGGQKGLPSMMFPSEPSRNWTNCERCTSIFANPSQIKCCGNGTSSASSSSVAIGYWSPNVAPSTWTPRTWQQNFTVKWIVGRARSVTVITDLHSSTDHLVFTEIPSMNVLNCMPLVETANADVTVNPINGNIQSFDIINELEISSHAFADNFVVHNGTRVDPEDRGYYIFNTTISYGRLFMTSMLTSASILNLEGNRILGFTVENTDDNTYTIRDEQNGLNMDFMTYSMYSMAQKDPRALLNVTLFSNLAEKTFSTFFQHFVSNNISLQTGGWAYQSINASLPLDLGPAVENALPGANISSYQTEINPISHTNRTVAARVSRRVQLLHMNAIAVWLSIGILSWLVLTTAAVAILQRRYLSGMLRNVECIGDVLVLVAGSENLIRAVREMQAGRLAPGDYDLLRTRLGWFVDRDGNLRWGIEMEERFMDGPRVQWVSGPEPGGDPEKQDGQGGRI